MPARDVTPVSLRPATAADRFLVRRWLGEPHVEAWWGSRASAEAEIALAMDSPSALCRIVIAADQPIGYAQAVDIGTWGGGMPTGMPPGAYDADLFIGSTVHRGQGHGAMALSLLRAEVFSTTLAVALGMVVSIRNEAAVRLLEKAGFRWVSIWQDPSLGACWVMLAERP